MTVPNPLPTRGRLTWPKRKPLHEWDDRSIIVVALTACLGPYALVLAAVAVLTFIGVLAMLAVLAVPVVLLVLGLMVHHETRFEPGRYR